MINVSAQKKLAYVRANQQRHYFLIVTY
eukprot:SAG31_NODE_30874_length_375_cov_0.702899_1_plen_27_part_10